MNLTERRKKKNPEGLENGKGKGMGENESRKTKMPICVGIQIKCRMEAKCS